MAGLEVALTFSPVVGRVLASASHDTPGRRKTRRHSGIEASMEMYLPRVAKGRARSRAGAGGRSGAEQASVVWSGNQTQQALCAGSYRRHLSENDDLAALGARLCKSSPKTHGAGCLRRTVDIIHLSFLHATRYGNRAQQRSPATPSGELPARGEPVLRRALGLRHARAASVTSS